MSGSLKEEVTLFPAKFRSVITIITLTLIGVVIELLQREIPGRSASLFDGVADFCGALIGVFGYNNLIKLKS